MNKSRTSPTKPPVATITAVIGMVSLLVLFAKSDFVIAAKNIAAISDAQFAQFVAGSMAIDPSTVQLATVDLDRDGQNDYRVALYQFTVRDEQRSGFRVYDAAGHVAFEDHSSAWDTIPVSWNSVQTGDADGDRKFELFVLGTEEQVLDGATAHTHQVVLKPSGTGFLKLAENLL